MQKALTERVITQSFTFHDLRAKSASDEADPSAATERLAHDDPRTTRRCTCESRGERAPAQKY
jgi:hypothetical protein